MMFIAAALILIVTSEVALGQDHRHAVPIYPLDMASHSVDDQYDGCSRNMTHQVQTKYLNEEISANISGFGKAWRDGEKKHSGPQDNLTRNNLIAISVYTSRQVYSKFNQDVITGKRKYQKLTYTWYSLHFWLTEAIQILKKTQHGCKSTYRGTNVKFNAKDQKEIRFGLFASSSLYRNVTKKFGNRSCFEIYTCHGADVSQYSEHPREKEVLIPPYEKFNITAIKKKGQDDVWCETVYMLNSSGIESNLNCAVAAADPAKYHRSHSLSQHYIRGGQITARRAFLSETHNRFLVKSKHGNKKGSRLPMLRVQQRKDSKNSPVTDERQNV